MAVPTPPPLPTQQKMLTDTGLVDRPWIRWFTTLGQLFSNIFNQTIQSSGVALPQETALNFSADFTITDNPKNGSTDVSLSKSGQPTVQFGSADVNPTGTNSATVPIVFPTPFATVPIVVANNQGFPAGVNDPVSCYPTDITTDGFTANLTCAVPEGGGGSTFTQSTTVSWIAISQ